LAYKVFNEDLRGRLRFVAHFFDWHSFGDRLTGNEKFWNMKNIQELIGKKICDDGEFTDEHFCASRSELNRLMEKVYYPVITCKEHQGKHTKEDWAISNECEKFHDQILIQIVTISQVLQQLGCEERRGAKKTYSQAVSEPQKMVLCGLLERLLNQLPAYEVDDATQRSEDFTLKVSTLYLELQKRTGIKPIFKQVLGIDHSKTYEDIDVIVERVANYIMEYNAYCEI